MRIIFFIFLFSCNQNETNQIVTLEKLLKIEQGKVDSLNVLLSKSKKKLMKYLNTDLLLGQYSDGTVSIDIFLKEDQVSGFFNGFTETEHGTKVFHNNIRLYDFDLVKNKISFKMEAHDLLDTDKKTDIGHIPITIFQGKIDKRLLTIYGNWDLYDFSLNRIDD